MKFEFELACVRDVRASAALLLPRPSCLRSATAPGCVQIFEALMNKQPDLADCHLRTTVEEEAESRLLTSRDL